jgi:hypothetical protein
MVVFDLSSIPEYLFAGLLSCKSKIMIDSYGLCLISGQKSYKGSYSTGAKVYFIVSPCGLD